MKTTPVRWGILGTADIARKNWKALRNTGNSTLVAVASRNVARSREFIAECQSHAPWPKAPRALGSYEAMLADREIEAVYIPLPTGLRREWVLRAAAAGKHVVCEKPCAISVAELREMIEACRRHRVQFMDGVMFMHSQRLDAIRRVLDDGISIGSIKRLNATFTFCAPREFLTDNIRMNSALEPQGCVGDLGWYCIRFALWMMKGKLPRQVVGRLLNERAGRNSPAPVPTEFSGELLFDGGVSAGFYCSFLTEHTQLAHVSGTKGHLVLSDYVLPFFGSELHFDVNRAAFGKVGCDFYMEPHSQRVAVSEYSSGHANAQETNLFRNFAYQVRSKRLNPHWPDIALKTQQVMEACLESARDGSRLVTMGRE